ncbi:histidine kinase [Microbacterium insulae]|uniref:Histidine kinase n=1 Tax=Microbacterium insulae TaxID=483014 RepID=A0ABW3AEL8_9MICO
MRTNPIGRVAAVLVALEGLGLGALTVWQIVAIVAGDTASIDSAIALIVLTAVGAAAVVAFAVAIWRGRSWGRSGAIVTQLLILAVALGAATGAYAEPTAALALAAPALGTLVLLILAVRAAGREAKDEASA